MKNVKNVILFVFSVALLGVMSCEEAALEENSPIDFVNVSNDKGIVDSYDIDRKSGDLLSSSDDFSEKSDIINGTVYDIVYHDNGNRTIYCWDSNDLCYEKGVGPGPCGPCDDDV